MTRFTCRGFEGRVHRVSYGRFDSWDAYVEVGGIRIYASARNREAAKSRVRRKLDAVERAFRERGFR